MKCQVVRRTPIVDVARSRLMFAGSMNRDLDMVQACGELAKVSSGLNSNGQASMKGSLDIISQKGQDTRTDIRQLV